MRFLSFNVFTILWFGVILLLTLTPGSNTEHQGVLFLDKIVHYSLFFVFTLLMIVGFLKQSDVSLLNRYAILSSILLTLGIGAVIEVLQQGVVGRDFDWFDIIANFSGTLSGVVMFYVLYRL